MKKIFITGIAAMSLALGGCDSYLDINDSPNSPSVDKLSTDLIFPGAEMAFANVYGDYMCTTGGYFAQYFSQYFGTSNYMDYSQFKQSATRSSSAYTQLTAGSLQNLKTVMEKASASGEWGTYLAATVIRVAAYQTMVDCYGAIPYSEALDMNNVTPKYDDGLDVYAGLVKELDEAVAKVNGGEKVCTNFLLPGKFASEWVKVANALKLRLLMRESNAVNVQSELSALVSEGNFPSGDVAWEGCWKDELGQANPFYTEDNYASYGGSQKNMILNLAVLATMNAAADARLEVFFDPNTVKREYQGGISGTNFTTTANYKANYWCRPHKEFDSPVYLITRSEIEFFLAEYEARYGSMAAAETHYNAAVEASFATAGVSGADRVLTVYPWEPGNWQKNLGIQKWVALSGVNQYEGYCELRRLKYPAFGTVTGDELYSILNDVYSPSLLVPGTLYTPIDVNTSLGANKLLQRWPYPNASSSRNSNVPDYEGDDKPIFWAK